MLASPAKQLSGIITRKYHFLGLSNQSTEVNFKRPYARTLVFLFVLEYL
jgi:hypothetical protein